MRSILLTALFDPRCTRAIRYLREKRRQLTGRRHVISVFLQIDDPYSYILSHYLPALQKHYDIDLRLYLSQALGDVYQPAPGLLAEYAVLDCTRLAAELGIPFLDKGDLPPTEHRIGLSNAVAALSGSDAFDEELRQVLAIFWRGDSRGAASMSRTADSEGLAGEVIADSQTLQKKLGHYNTAMLHYAGEWFWGVDRLHYLTKRLDELGVANSDAPDPLLASVNQAMKYSLPVKPPAAAKELPPLEFFISFRSPYSYVALRPIYEIADAFGIALKLRPVLPMVMRGMQVPQRKIMYIVKDTLREAKRRKVAFGKIADPVGRGVERCLAVFQYAESENRARDFLLNAGEAIWAEAIDVATDEGMRKVTARTGLFWPDVEKAIKSHDWLGPTEANRESMMDSGSWGVPTVRMGNFVIWGQDRDWMLLRHIEELCDTGDGILV